MSIGATCGGLIRFHDGRFTIYQMSGYRLKITTENESSGAQRRSRLLL